MSPFIANPVFHIFPVISMFGLYVVSSLMLSSGHAQAFVNSVKDVPLRLLPGNKNLVQTYYTGLGPLDAYLANLQFIFVPMVDGSSPELSLLGWHWGNLLLALFSVMLVESLQAQRKLDIIFFAAWGLAIQYCGYFVTMPLYCYIHLLRSIRAQVVTAIPAAVAADIPELALTAVRTVPMAMLLGYVLPSVAMSASWIHTSKSRQLAIAFWQNFPVWIAMVQMTVTWWTPRRISPISRRSEHQKAQVQASKASPKESDALRFATVDELNRSVRQLYKATAVISAFIHVSGLMPILFATLWPDALLYISPFWIETTHLESLKLINFLLPPKWDSSVQITSMAEGAFNFLRYDYYIGTLAVLLWAALLQRLNHYKDFQARKNNIERAAKSNIMGLKQILMIAVSTAVLGPGFTITNIMSQRELS